jgi:D-alanyl-D-alanine carboxypeptidase
MKLIGLVSILLMVTYSCFASTNRTAVNIDIVKELQEVVNNYLNEQGKKEYLPGMVVTIQVNSDKTRIFTLAGGKKGFVPHSSPMHENYLFQIGSITKSFTAAIILQLAGEGKLTLDDKVGKWLPQYTMWQEVTIRELLNMTSGISNYTEDKVFAHIAFPHNKYAFTLNDLLKYAHPQRKITSKKPRAFDYSNSNYILAAKIIEVASHDSYLNQLYQRIIVPFHLTQTYYLSAKIWPIELRPIYPKLAHGYFKDVSTNKISDITADNLSWAGPAGGIIATTQDTLKWVNLLYKGEIFAPSYRQKSLAELKSLVSMNSGNPIRKTGPDALKGFGLGVGNIYVKDLATNFWFYEGSTLGYRVAYIYNPENHTIILASLNSKAEEGKKNGADKIGLLLTNLYKVVLKYYPDDEGSSKRINPNT